MIRLLWATSLGWYADEPTYLETYDPDATEEGVWASGMVAATNSVDEAKRFPSIADAMEEYGRVSTTRPLRPDGELNRPLLAFTITFERIEREE